jgi:hypothetical protein
MVDLMVAHPWGDEGEEEYHTRNIRDCPDSQRILRRLLRKLLWKSSDLLYLKTVQHLLITETDPDTPGNVLSPCEIGLSVPLTMVGMLGKAIVAPFFRLKELAKRHVSGIWFFARSAWQ